MNFKMKTSRILALVLALSMMACLLAACGGSDSSDKKYKMQAILISSSSQVTAGQGKAMEDYAKEKGVDFSVAFYDQNIATEAELIENAVTSGVDCLILHNQSEGDCVDAINAAVDAGVTVVLYATDVPTINYSVIAKDIEMDAILAVALGGNALSGGKFCMAGSVIGAYVIQFLTTTLYAMEVKAAALPAYKAVVVIALVVFSAPVVREKISLAAKKLRPQKSAENRV